MKYLFILNPNAGKKRAKVLVDLIDDQMSLTDHYYEFAYTTAAGDATNIAAEGVEDKFDIMVAVGGDGTVNEVASGLINTTGVLGILPTGSGNGVARSLGIPLPFEKNLKFLINPQITVIDTGKVNNKHFIGVGGTGYDALIGKKFQDFGIRGPIPYFVIGTKELLFYKSKEYRVVFDGESITITALLIAFANTRQYGNGAIIAPQAHPADGFLDLCIIKSLSFSEILKTTPMMFRGNLNESDKYVHRRCKSMRIESANNELDLHRDGEPDESTRILEIAIEEKSLKICSPVSFNLNSL